MKIGNIIFENELINHTEVDYINYINKPMEYDLIDKSKPTLYVGWNFMKSCNPNNEIIQNADILKKKIITNELYWEFSFVENKSSHVRGVENFINNVPKLYFTSKFRYTNLDPIFFSVNDINELCVILTPKKIVKCYNYKNEMLYLLYGNDIIGIDLRVYGYFDFNIPQIIDLVKSSAFAYYDDLYSDIYIKYYKIFPTFSNLKRYIVTLVE